MPRLALTLAAAALLAGLVGCGGDDGASSPADAVRSYNGAVADGDGERACAYLEPAAREELQSSTQGAARGSCEQVIELLSAFYDDATKDRLREIKVAAVTQGERATARFTSPIAFGGADQEQNYELRAVGGDWMIASLGLTTPDPALDGP